MTQLKESLKSKVCWNFPNDEERKEEVIFKLVRIPKDPFCSLLWEPAS